MILDHLTIENFGAYGGRQEADLSPSPGRPIILFGGMNGGGKTTLLDAIQLAFYGSKARLSNRGRLAYRDYLRDSIHRHADPGEGAGITLRFHRYLDGEPHSFELQRHWRLGIRGIEETLRVLKDGLPDEVLTDHWDETIAAFLPVGISHLFFFDGEQIKDLAEGSHAADIIGAGINGLLGLDLLERLTTDLRVFERGVRKDHEEGQQHPATQEIRQAEGELALIDRELERIGIAEGAKVNEASQLAKVLHDQEARFKAAGGDLYLRRNDLTADRQALEHQKAALETELRELIAGPLPLALVDDLLSAIAEQARRETRIRHAQVLHDALEERDRTLVTALKSEPSGAQAAALVERLLVTDREQRIGLAQEPVILDTDDQFPARIDHLRGTLIPEAQHHAKELTNRIGKLDEDLARLTADLERVPMDAHIADVQSALDQARNAHQAKLAEIADLKLRRDTLLRQQQTTLERIDRLGLKALDTGLADDDRQRMLKHSARVRSTLKQLRTRVVAHHTGNIESLMLAGDLYYVFSGWQHEQRYPQGTLPGSRHGVRIGGAGPQGGGRRACQQPISRRSGMAAPGRSQRQDQGRHI